MIRHVNMGARVKDCISQIPILDVEASIQPITRTVLRVVLKICGTFKWNDRAHGKTGEPFWIWIEDPDNDHIYHSEYFMMHKKHVSFPYKSVSARYCTHQHTLILIFVIICRYTVLIFNQLTTQADLAWLSLCGLFYWALLMIMWLLPIKMAAWVVSWPCY